MELTSVVPWGRSLAEYRNMFFLDDADREKTILGCSDGPASFNSEWTKIGGTVISADPVYQFSPEQIKKRIDVLYPQIMEQMSKTSKNYAWSNIKNVADLGRIRMNAMRKFLADFSSAENGRYVSASLPDLPFEDQQFDIALCSHYLFLYSDHISRAQHLSSIKELCRVAKEIRIYPLVCLDGSISRHIEPVLDLLKKLNCRVSQPKVNDVFQTGATRALVAAVA